MKFAKNISIVSLIGLSLVSFTSQIPRASKVFGPATRAAAQAAWARKLAWQTAEFAAGAGGATAATLAATSSKEQDMPKPGYEQESMADMNAPADLRGQVGEQVGEEQEAEGIQREPKPVVAMNIGSVGPISVPRERNPQEQDVVNLVDLLVHDIKKHNVAEMQKLISLGVSVNQKDSYASLPLAVAIQLGFTDIVTMLLDEGARIDLVDRKVIESAQAGLKNILQFAWGMQAELRAAINDQDKFGQTLLMRAVTQNDLKKVRKYLEWGADIDLPDNNGNTPLLRALILGSLEMADMLIAAGADVARSNKAGVTPHQFILSLFLEGAVKAGNVSAVTELIAQAKTEGLDLNKIVMGSTPLIVAIEQGNAEMVKILLDAGVDVNKDINGLMPIRIAVEANKVEAAKLLLAAGANANETVGNGVFLLMVASAMGSKDMVWALLAAGANSAVQVQGKSAEDVARHFGHMDVANLLEEVEIERHRGGRQAQDKALEEARRLEHKALMEILEKAQREQEGEQSK